MAIGAATTQVSQPATGRRAGCAGERVGRLFEGEGHRDGGELGQHQQHHGAHARAASGRAAPTARYRATDARWSQQRPAAGGDAGRFVRRLVAVVRRHEGPGKSGVTRRRTAASYRIERHIGGFRPDNHPAGGMIAAHRRVFRRAGLTVAPTRRKSLCHEQNGKNEQNPDGLRLLRFRPGDRPGLYRKRPRLRPDPRRARYRPGLRRRRRRPDGRSWPMRCSSMAARSPASSPSSWRPARARAHSACRS